MPSANNSGMPRDIGKMTGHRLTSEYLKRVLRVGELVDARTGRGRVMQPRVICSHGNDQFVRATNHMLDQSDAWTAPMQPIPGIVWEELSEGGSSWNTPRKFKQRTHEMELQIMDKEALDKREEERMYYVVENHVNPRSIITAVLAENQWDVDKAVEEIMRHWDAYADKSTNTLDVQYAFRLGKRRFDALPLEVWVLDAEGMEVQADKIEALQIAIFEDLDMQDDHISTYTACTSTWESEIVFPKPAAGQPAPALGGPQVKSPSKRAKRQLKMAEDPDDEEAVGSAQKKKGGKGKGNGKGKGKQPDDGCQQPRKRPRVVDSDDERPAEDTDEDEARATPEYGDAGNEIQQQERALESLRKQQAKIARKLAKLRKIREQITEKNTAQGSVTLPIGVPQGRQGPAEAGEMAQEQPGRKRRRSPRNLQDPALPPNHLANVGRLMSIDTPNGRRPGPRPRLEPYQYNPRTGKWD